MKTPTIIAATVISTVLLLLCGGLIFGDLGGGWNDQDDGSYTLGKELQDLWEAKEKGAITEPEYTTLKSIYLNEILEEEEHD